MSRQTNNVGHQLTFGFYDDVRSEAEKTKLRHARKMDGLAEEITMLRLRLQLLARNLVGQEEFPRLELLLKGLSVLHRLVAVQYKLSPSARDNLADNLAKVVDEIRSSLMEDFASPEDEPGPKAAPAVAAPGEGPKEESKNGV